MSPSEFIDNSDWAAFLPDAPPPPRQRALPDHSDCSPVDVERVAGHLRRGGTLGSMPGYEERTGQLEMAAAIAEAFNSRCNLMYEAGTGTGKSLAYLVPAIAWASTNDTPVVVSTATRNLQSQLMTNDIPTALKTLGDDVRDFTVALLKGRMNYLCLKAVDEFFSGGYWTMGEEDRAAMPGFIEWLKSTPDGDLDAYDGLPRDLLSRPGEECSGRSCPFHSKCFVYKARRRALAAHLVVVNHSLVLSEAVNGGVSLLPAYGRLVMDEAHNLEDIATDHFSKLFSEAALHRILNRLLRSSPRKKSVSGGVLGAIGRLLSRGGVADGAEAAAIVRKTAEAVSSLAALSAAAAGITAAAKPLLGSARSDGPVRYFASTIRTPEVVDAQNRFENALACTVTLLHSLRESLDSAAAEDGTGRLSDYARQVDNIAVSLVSFANETAFALAADSPGTHVYWIERVRLQKRRAEVRLTAAPLSVAEDLRKLLYSPKDTTVLCSATLRTGSGFKYMAKRLGFFPEDGDEKGRYLTGVATSPFDYLRQCLVLAPDFMPDPAVDQPGYEAALSAMLERLFPVTRGRSLVLFTSHDMMRSVAERLRGSLDGIDLLVQGEGMSREAMAAALRAAERPTVLFGAQSFWEGVDVAGDALVCVVLARLPFAQQGDPVNEARGEKVEREGGRKFGEFILPNAAIRFRQGFGRLIRTRSDRGVVIAADPRIVTKNYGGVFRKSIPASVRIVTGIDELMDAVGGVLTSATDLGYNSPQMSKENHE